MKKLKKHLFGHRGWLALGAVVSLCVLGGLIYYTTVSLLKDKDQERNDFAFADLRVEVDEPGWTDLEGFDSEEPIDKEVIIKNTGTQPILVRVMLLPSILKEAEEAGEAPLLLPSSYTYEGETTQENSDDKSILKFELNTTDWKDGGDGYFYYLDYIPVADPPTDRLTLLKTVQLIKENLPEGLRSDYDGARLTIDVKAEAIGLSKWAYQDAFWQGTEPTDSPLADIAKTYKEIVEKWSKENGVAEGTTESTNPSGETKK